MLWAAIATSSSIQSVPPWSNIRQSIPGQATVPTPLGVMSPLLAHHPLYTALGSNKAARQAIYRELFRFQLDPGMVDEIRAATIGNYALGSSQFQAQVAAALGRRVTPGKSGRPRKRKEPESLELFGED
jgi:putative transposase